MDNREELKRSLAEEEQRAKDSLANVEKMKKQLEELNKKEEQPTVSATGVYFEQIPNKIHFCFSAENEVFESRFTDHLFDRLRLKNNNCFATKEQAEQEALRREGQEFIRRCAMLWNKDHDWRKNKSLQHFIFLNKGLEIGDTFCAMSNPFFDSKELAEKCIKELKAKYNEEQIKTIFGVK